MIRIQLTVEIARTPEEVFALLNDIERLPEWQGSAIEAHTVGPLAEGSRITERRRLMGREVDGELEVVTYEPPRRLTLRSLDGPVRFTVDHQLGGGGRRHAADVGRGGRARRAPPADRADARAHRRAAVPPGFRPAEGAARGF